MFPDHPAILARHGLPTCRRACPPHLCQPPLLPPDCSPSTSAGDILACSTPDQRQHAKQACRSARKAEAAAAARPHQPGALASLLSKALELLWLLLLLGRRLRRCLLVGGGAAAAAGVGSGPSSETPLKAWAQEGPNASRTASRWRGRGWAGAVLKESTDLCASTLQHACIGRQPGQGAEAFLTWRLGGSFPCAAGPQPPAGCHSSLCMTGRRCQGSPPSAHRLRNAAAGGEREEAEGLARGWRCGMRRQLP